MKLSCIEVSFTGRITFKYIEDSGTTDLLVNKKDPNELKAFNNVVLEITTIKSEVLQEGDKMSDRYGGKDDYLLAWIL